MTDRIRQSTGFLRTWLLNDDHHWRLPVALFLLLVITGFLGAAQTGLFDRDEPRYAQAAREMVRSGNWVLPMFNGEPRLHKPVLIYWLMSLSISVFGDSAVAVRLPSILAGAGSGVLLFLFTSRLYGRRVAGWSLLVWATAPLTLVESRMATTDATLNLIILAMLGCAMRLLARPGRWVAVCFWILFALSILTKGPLAILFIVPAVLGYRIFSGKKIPIHQFQFGWGISLSLLLVSPWLISVIRATEGDFLRFAVGRELVGRMITPAEEHSGIPGYYLIMLLPMFLPWCGFLPMALRQAWNNRKSDPNIGFLIGWAFGPVPLLELMATKLVHYHYASYAALAILTGIQLARLEHVSLRPNLLEGGRMLRSGLAGLLILTAIFMLALAWVGIWQVAVPCLISALILISNLYFMIPEMTLGYWNQVVNRTGRVWFMTVLLMLGWMLPAGESTRLSRKVANALESELERMDASVVLGEFREPSLIYQLNQVEPVPISRSIAQLRSIVIQNGATMMPMTEAEWRKTSEVDDLNFQPIQRLTSLDWDRGKRREITLCLITLKPEKRVAQLPVNVGNTQPIR